MLCLHQGKMKSIEHLSLSLLSEVTPPKQTPGTVWRWLKWVLHFCSVGDNQLTRNIMPEERKETQYRLAVYTPERFSSWIRGEDFFALRVLLFCQMSKVGLRNCNSNIIGKD